MRTAQIRKGACVMWVKTRCGQVPPGTLIQRAGVYVHIIGHDDTQTYGWVLAQTDSRQGATVVIDQKGYQPVKVQPGQTLIMKTPHATQCMMSTATGSAHDAAPPASGTLTAVAMSNSQVARYRQRPAPPPSRSMSRPPTKTAPAVLEDRHSAWMDQRQQRRNREIPARRPRQSVYPGRFQGSRRLPGLEEDDYGEDSRP